MVTINSINQSINQTNDDGLCYSKGEKINNLFTKKKKKATTEKHCLVKKENERTKIRSVFLSFLENRLAIFT